MGLGPLALAYALEIPICPSALVLRVPCPGCGLTRASVALLCGDVGAALALQPLALAVCPLLGGAALFALYRYLRTGHVYPDRWPAAPILILSMAALTLVWVVRWFGYFGGPVPV